MLYYRFNLFTHKPPSKKREKKNHKVNEQSNNMLVKNYNETDIELISKNG